LQKGIKYLNEILCVENQFLKAKHMRILHAPIEIAGQVSLSVAGLREAGVVANAAVEPHPFAYEYRPDILLPVGASAEAIRQKIEMSLHLASQNDVINYHFGHSFLPDYMDYIDAYINAASGKKCIVEFWGTDVRIPEIEFERNPYFKVTKGENGESARIRMQHWAEITKGHVIISDACLEDMVKPFFPHIHYVRQRINLDSFKPLYPSPEVNIPRVVHIPSHKGFKGTEVIREVVHRLKESGAELDYLEISGVTHDRAMQLCRTADIVIDQLRCGAHGILSIEAMALGKPVMVYIMDSLIDWYPSDLPIINVNPDTLESELAKWVQMPKKRNELGKASRAYVEKHHDYKRNAQRLIEVYAQLPGK